MLGTKAGHTHTPNYEYDHTILLYKGGWADARLGSALARNYGGCTYYTQAYRGRKGDSSTTKGSCIENKSCLHEEKENAGIRINVPATNFTIRYTMTNSSSCSNNSSIATQSSSSGGSNTLYA